MPGRSPLSTTEAERAELQALASSRDRGEADRARAVLLTAAGWTSPQIAEAFGVREDRRRSAAARAGTGEAGTGEEGRDAGFV